MPPRIRLHLISSLTGSRTNTGPNVAIVIYCHKIIAMRIYLGQSLQLWFVETKSLQSWFILANHCECDLLWQNHGRSSKKIYYWSAHVFLEFFCLLVSLEVAVLLIKIWIVFCSLGFSKLFCNWREKTFFLWCWKWWFCRILSWVWTRAALAKLTVTRMFPRSRTPSVVNPRKQSI